MMSRDILEDIYRKYHRREYVHPDPLEFLYDHEDLRDREIVAMVASSLAYGRVSQIIKGVSWVLERMRPAPWVFLSKASPETIRRVFSGFRHRFTTDEDLSAMLVGIKRILGRYGHLHACFCQGLNDDDSTILPALCAFTKELTARADGPLNHLVPSPKKGSACKRLNLFLRWMVREDEVDPGGWKQVPPSKLIVPVDTHMHRFSLLVGFTRRKHADLIAAMEITESFRAMTPEDPVRYDFSVTRLGIRGDKGLGSFLGKERAQEAVAYSSVCSMMTL